MPTYSGSQPIGVYTPTPTALPRQAARIAAAVSRRKQALRSAASGCVNGGTNRVFTCPARGAFVMTANAQRLSPGRICLDGSSILCGARLRLQCAVQIGRAHV